MWFLRWLLRQHPDVRRIKLPHSGVICPQRLSVPSARVAATVTMTLATSARASRYKPSAVLLWQETRRQAVRRSVSKQVPIPHPPTIVVIRRVVVRVNQGRVGLHIARSVRENLVEAGSLGATAVPRSIIGKLRICGPLMVLLPLSWVGGVRLRVRLQEINFVAVEEFPCAPSTWPDYVHGFQRFHALVQPQTGLGIIGEGGH